ncbi:hypothetical protein ALC56_15336, partial [Trachymyrmex septentrionalis]
NRGVSIRKASALFHVPKTTLYEKYKDIFPVEATMGPTILSTNEERELFDWMIYTSKKGFPVTKTQLLDSVQMLITQLKRKNFFTKNIKAFIRRHSELAWRMTQNLTNIRASVTEDNLRQWFSEVEAHLSKHGLLNIDAQQDPQVSSGVRPRLKYPWGYLSLGLIVMEAHHNLGFGGPSMKETQHERKGSWFCWKPQPSYGVYNVRLSKYDVSSNHKNGKYQQCCNKRELSAMLTTTCSAHV